MRFSRKRRASSKMRNLTERGCPEKLKMGPKWAQNDGLLVRNSLITKVNRMKLRLKNIILLLNSIKKFRVLNLTEKVFYRTSKFDCLNLGIFGTNRAIIQPRGRQVRKFVFFTKTKRDVNNECCLQHIKVSHAFMMIYV